MTDELDPPPIGWTADDATMAELRAWLVEQGYVVLFDAYDFASFGNQSVTLSRPLAIRLVRDRGRWAVEMIGADGHWKWIGQWRAELRGAGSQLLTATDQADILREMLAEIEGRGLT